MRTRFITFILASLPLAFTAQAGEISMDSGAYGSGARGDCASARSLHSEDRDAADNNTDVRYSGTASGSARLKVSDEADEASESESAGSSATGKSMSVPVKSRSTRWQSLVPGAIK
ncbi:hypothetical protein [Dokdonella sp.]|uniref:hypothetical protein n=1 Tax=Dokdonella sp. TaxID=2291710 RepID=UPI00352846BD